MCYLIISSSPPPSIVNISSCSSANNLVYSIRYFLSINNPEKKDFNFTYEGFINSINSDLLGKWGNFVNRTLQFINKYFTGKLTNLNIDVNIEKELKCLYNLVGKNIDDGNTKDGLINIFDFIKYSNKYFDEKEPWKLIESDKNKCEEILYNCCNIIFNINNLLKPYLIDSTNKVERYLNNNINSWNYKVLEEVKISKDIKPLFIRYDKSNIEKL